MQILFGKPLKISNWNKWSDTCLGCTVKKPSQLKIPYQSFPKKSHQKLKVICILHHATSPQPPKQSWTLVTSIFHIHKLFRNFRTTTTFSAYTKSDTFSISSIERISIFLWLKFHSNGRFLTSKSATYDSPLTGSWATHSLFSLIGSISS